jgi:hypothetical protein
LHWQLDHFEAELSKKSAIDKIKDIIADDCKYSKKDALLNVC